MKLVVVSMVGAGLMFAQAPAQNQVVTLESQPLYRVTVVSRTAKAVNYRHRSGATKIDFKGTALMPEARGEAKVESKQGYIEVEVEFDDINKPATQFGPEYLTYVMWAITPEGRASNLGEILLNGTKSKLNVSTELQSFGLIVTAEPYFAVSQPSDVVVMENIVRADTLGKVDIIDAKYELLQRGQYVFNVDKSALTKISSDTRSRPLELLEARNAVQIARWTGADKYAMETFQKAEQSLLKAEDYHTRKQTNPSKMIAREAVQTAEDARLITIKRIEEEKLANERRAAADRESAEKAKAEESNRLRAQADQQRQLEEKRRAAAEEDRRRADANAKLEAERRAQAEATTLEAQKAQAAAQAERLAAERAKAEADAARQAALVEQQRLAQLAEQSKQAAAEAERGRLNAEQEKEALRRKLLDQFNMILQTRDSARGLIVNMSDVLFDTGKFTLRPAAREKLARVSGIILAYPGLKLEIEGHTDNVGGDDYNQKLSEQRAQSVLQYLTSQGMQPGIVTAKGMGETTPVASNDNAAGRQQNRRVELIVSGEVIGTTITSSTTTRQ